MARYALVIGIDTNLPPLKSLSKTKGDAEAIADLLTRHGNFVEVKRLIGTVTQKQLETALQALLPEVLKDSLIKKKWGENEVFYPQEIKK
jgi:hypothetical protein